MARSTTPAWRPARPIVAPLVATVLLVGGCGGPAATAGPSSTISATAATSSLPVPTASAQASAAAVATGAPTVPPVTVPPITEPPPSIAPAIGVAIPVGGQQLMTVVAAEDWPGAPGVKPAKGKAFFTVSIQIDALALTSWDSADFKVRDGDRAYGWRTGRAPHLYSGSNMAVGHHYIGWITYEVPKASVGELTLVYKPGFLDGATFRVPLFE